MTHELVKQYQLDTETVEEAEVILIDYFEVIQPFKVNTQFGIIHVSTGVRFQRVIDMEEAYSDGLIVFKLSDLESHPEIFKPNK